MSGVLFFLGEGRLIGRVGYQYSLWGPFGLINTGNSWPLGGLCKTSLGVADGNGWRQVSKTQGARLADEMKAEFFELNTTEEYVLVRHVSLQSYLSCVRQ